MRFKIYFVKELLICCVNWERYTELQADRVLSVEWGQGDESRRGSVGGGIHEPDNKSTGQTSNPFLSASCVTNLHMMAPSLSPASVCVTFCLSFFEPQWFLVFLMTKPLLFKEGNLIWGLWCIVRVWLCSVWVKKHYRSWQISYFSPLKRHGCMYGNIYLAVARTTFRCIAMTLYWH